MEEPGRLQSMGLLRVGHDWATSLSFIGGGSGNPLQYSCLENPRDGGAWWAAVYGVAQSRTRLKKLSSSSSSSPLLSLLILLLKLSQVWLVSLSSREIMCSFNICPHAFIIFSLSGTQTFQTSLTLILFISQPQNKSFLQRALVPVRKF